MAEEKAAKRKADEDFERFSSIADELGLKDDGEEKDRSNFIHSAMTRKGYKPRMAYDDPDPEEGEKEKKEKKNGDYFGQYRN